MITTSISCLFTQAALLIVFFLSTNTLWGQTDSTAYHYSDFLLPDIDRKALEVDFELRGNNFKHTEKQLPYLDQKGGNFSNNISMTYSRFRNNKRLQSFQQFNFHEDLFLTRTDADGFPDRTNRFQTHISASSVERIYYKPQRFFEYSPKLIASFTQLNRKTDPPIFTFKSWSVESGASLSLKIGKGRIEPIGDVFLAKFMADDLLEKGILSAPLSEAALFSLGQVMADARNRRIFDFRRQRIFELTQLDKWFKENGVTTTGNDIVYFTTLADNWLYAFKGNRQSGKRYALGIASNVLFYHFRLIDSGHGNTEFHYVTKIFGEYVKERPVNQFWQSTQNFGIGITYWNHPVIANYGTKYSVLIPYVFAGVSYGYYPNSRTELLAGANLNYEYYRAEPGSEIPFGGYHVIFPKAFLSATYFINHQLRLQAVMEGRYVWSSDSIHGPLNGAAPPPLFLREGISERFIWSNITLHYSIF